MTRSSAIALLLISLAGPLGGCAYKSAGDQEASSCRAVGPKALLGALGGATGGAAIGAAAGRGTGALIGAGVGLLAGMIAGHVADKQDCEAAQVALAANLENARLGQSIPWQSTSGNTGEYQVTSNVYEAHDSATCRHATSLPAPGSGEQSKSLVACRNSNGDWNYYDS